MKIITNIVAALLGLFFVYAGLNFFFQWQVPPSPPAGSPAANFIGAMYGSGYLKFVKILEVIGGLLLLVPCLRNWGLVVTGAIAVNIACFHQFFFGGLKDPTVIGLIVLALIVTWSRRCALCCVNTCGCSSGCGCGTNGGCACGSTDKPASTGGCCGGK